MYLTAQLVSSPIDGREGINVLLYRHGGKVPPEIPWLSWNAPNLARIVDEFPGTLAASEIEVPPGGNSVLGYLDVVAPDEEDTRNIGARLDDFAAQWSPELLDRVHNFGAIAIRFNVAPVLRAGAVQQLQTLAKRAVGLLQNPTPGGWTTQGPIRVLLSVDGEGNRAYSLDDPSIARLRSVHGPGWSPPKRVSVSFDVGSSLIDRSEDLSLTVVPVLTGVSLEALAPLGGVSVVRVASGEVLWQWPVSGGFGYCLRCHQHYTLSQGREGGFWCSACGNQQETDGLWVATLS